MGSNIIQALVKQLQGTVEAKNDEGAKFIIKFKKNRYLRAGVFLQVLVKKLLLTLSFLKIYF